MHLAPFPLANLSLLKNCWIWIPKLICWNLWLERNGRIFRDTASPPVRLAAKVKVLVNELVASKPLLHNETLPDQGTFSWFYDLDPSLITRTKTLHSQHSSWEIRIGEQEFLKWRSSLEKHVLMVDGASKGNPGKVGGGDIILSPEGNIILSFAWGLGLLSNNQAEYLALWHGLHQARRLGILNLVVFGDSRIVIQSLARNRRPKQLPLAQQYSWIQSQVAEFGRIRFFHVLRGLNHQADLEANVGSALCRGEIKINGSTSFFPIP